RSSQPRGFQRGTPRAHERPRCGFTRNASSSSSSSPGSRPAPVAPRRLATSASMRAPRSPSRPTEMAGGTRYSPRVLEGQPSGPREDLAPVEATERARWLVRLRWLAIALAALTLAAASSFAKAFSDLHVTALGAVLAILALANFFVSAKVR